ncbi:MAG: O-antigen ligase family protein, partial [Thermoleophilaceae bacterium]
MSTLERRAPGGGIQVAPPVLLLVAGLVAIGFGALVPAAPFDSIAVICLVPLALAAPTASLALVLAITVLVPFDVQNRLSIGGGAGVPGLLVADLLVGLGLCRLVVLAGLRRTRLRSAQLAGFVLLGLLLAALAHGVAAGASVSDAGNEARCAILGVGAFILALPLLEQPTSRRRLQLVLLALGAALGLWGIAQWVFDVAYTAAGDVGVRPGIDQIASVGGGQLQGGLYAYPVAVTLSFAALLSARGRAASLAVPAAIVLALNSVCVVLTYERTIWGATVIGCLIVAIRFGRGSWRTAGSLVAIGALGFLGLAGFGSSALPTAVGRVTSVARYSSDNSIEARRVESAAVIRAIRAQPVAGAGYGATITWGKDGVFATTTTGFSHDGYLWLAWK